MAPPEVPARRIRTSNESTRTTRSQRRRTARSDTSHAEAVDAAPSLLEDSTPVNPSRKKARTDPVPAAHAYTLRSSARGRLPTHQDADTDHSATRPTLSRVTPPSAEPPSWRLRTAVEDSPLLPSALDRTREPRAPPAHGRVPRGVRDLYPLPHSPLTVCRCPPVAVVVDESPLQRADAHAFLQRYGAEYAAALRQREQRERDEALRVLAQRGGVPNRRKTPSELLALPDTRGALQPDAIGTSPAEALEPLPFQPSITGKMRAILVNWLVEVAAEYKVSVDAYHLAVTLLDIVLQNGPTQIQLDQISDNETSDDDEQHPQGPSQNAQQPQHHHWKRFYVHRSDFQALGCTCLWIASKLEDRTPPLQDDLVYISDQSFDAERLRAWENRICDGLGFRLHRVTPLHFVHQALRASQACASCQNPHPVLRQLVLYLLALGRLPLTLNAVTSPPSLLAASAVYLGRATLGITTGNDDDPANGFWSPTLCYYTGYTKKDLTDTVLALHRYQSTVDSSEYRAAYLEYKHRNPHLAVSLRMARCVSDLGLDLEPPTAQTVGPPVVYR